MNIENLHKLYLIDGLVDTDTRYIRENSLFFALKGDNFNGNKFAEEALKKGAKYAIVDEVEYKTSENIILVNDVLETLQELANFHRNKLKIPIIALTGSNGKTTTKELINAVLSTTYKTSATKGNLNNHIGVPLTLLSMTAATEIGIVEMGANHLKEIEFLPLSVKTLIYIMGLRFLTDYLNNGIYFKTTHKTHNLNRAKNQMALLKNVIKNFEEIKQITYNSFNLENIS